jgi:hypothetical protein
VAPTATVTETVTTAGPSAPASPSTAQSSAAAAPPSSAASGGAGGLAACSTTALRLTVGDSQAQGGAGNSYYPLNFTDTSGSACSSASAVLLTVLPVRAGQGVAGVTP